MPTCPRCQQFVEAQAISCPTCRLTLKAHGHPGMTLHRATGDEYLCQTCTYHEDDTCNFPQRPYATECTLYHNSTAQQQAIGYKPRLQTLLGLWLRRNSGWIILLGLVTISILVALRR